MIIKMQDVTGAALAKLVNFIESEGNKLPSSHRVFSIKSVGISPGSEKGLYAVDLDMQDDYYINNGTFNARRRTDPKFLLQAYEILVGR